MPNIQYYYPILGAGIYLNDPIDPLKYVDVDGAGVRIGNKTIRGMYVVKPYDPEYQYGVLITVNLGPGNNMNNTYFIEERGDRQPSFRMCLDASGLDYKQQIFNTDTNPPNIYYSGPNAPGVENIIDAYGYPVRITSFIQQINFAGPSLNKRENVLVMAVENPEFPLRLGIQLNAFYNPDYINGVTGSVRWPDPRVPLTVSVQPIGTAPVNWVEFKSEINIQWLYDLFKPSTIGNENVPVVEQVDNPDVWTTTKFLHIGTIDTDYYGQLTWTEPQNLIIEIPD